MQERFGLYYVGLFIVEGDYAVLRAGTGQAGENMLAHGHRLRVGGESFIGWCVAHDHARIALDVGQDAVHFDNPLLPATRSEMALPLHARWRVLGAMTVQSDAEAAFDETGPATMQTVADLVAGAIDNARLLAETQKALQEMEAVHRHYLRQAWTEYLAERPAGYDTAAAGTVPDELLRPEIEAVLASQEAAASGPGGDGRPAHSALVTPVVLRGTAIGALGIHDDDASRQWTGDEIALAQALAARLAQTAENMRLLEETQRQAGRERLIGELTARMRQTLDMEAILATSAREIGRALGLAAIDLHVRAAAEPAGAATGPDPASVPTRGDGELVQGSPDDRR